MKKIVYTLALLTSVVLAACHNHGGETTMSDSVVATQTDEDTGAIRGVEPTNDQDTSQGYVRQNNEEEDINAGLFSRKEKTMYSAEQLCGEWVCGTLHEVYNSDGTGLQWDTKDDVSREEAQKFTWKIENNSLRQVYSMQLGGVVPRVYTVTFADDESLVYKDDFGESFMWDKKN